MQSSFLAIEQLTKSWTEARQVGNEGHNQVVGLLPLLPTEAAVFFSRQSIIHWVFNHEVSAICKLKHNLKSLGLASCLKPRPRSELVGSHSQNTWAFIEFRFQTRLKEKRFFVCLLSKWPSYLKGVFHSSLIQRLWYGRIFEQNEGVCNYLLVWDQFVLRKLF